MSWFSDLFMSSKEKAEREHKRKEAERAERNKRWLEDRKRKEEFNKEQQRIQSRFKRNIPTTGFDVRNEIKRDEQKRDYYSNYRSSDDLLNPLNPLSPISPISVWNDNDDHHHRHSDTPQDNHHHSHDNEYSSPSSSDSSSYDSSSFDSGGSSGDY
jgi:hypothetical protein